MKTNLLDLASGEGGRSFDGVTNLKSMSKHIFWDQKNWKNKTRLWRFILRFKQFELTQLMSIGSDKFELRKRKLSIVI